MAISNKTLEQIGDILYEWQKDMSLEKEEMKILFEELSRVEGNKSFKDSISMLLSLYK